MINFDYYQKTIKNLELQYENYRSLEPSIKTLTKEGIEESLFRRFKICFESTHKTLHKYLIEEFSVKNVTKSPRAIFKKANEYELFSSSIKPWLGYQERKNNASHEYGEKHLKAIIEILPAFIDDVIGLYQTMSNNTWE